MDRIWKIVENRLEKGDSYDAYQLLISRLSRFDVKESINFGFEKSKYFDDSGYNDIACHICSSLIKKAREEKIHIENNHFNSIMYILGSSKFCNEKSKLLNDTLLWCKDNEYENKDLIFKLHIWASNHYFVHKNFPKAQLYVILTENSTLYANILYEWSKFGYKSEKDLFLLRAILVLLSLNKVVFAHELFDKYCQLINENNLNDFNFDNPSSPIQLSYFLISVCELNNKKVATVFFDLIKNKYNLLIRRDPNFGQIIDKIGQIYFDKQDNSSNNILSNIFSMFKNNTNTNIQEN